MDQILATWLYIQDVRLTDETIILSFFSLPFFTLAKYIKWQNLQGQTTELRIPETLVTASNDPFLSPVMKKRGTANNFQNSYIERTELPVSFSALVNYFLKT